jgi:hypothetical protein
LPPYVLGAPRHQALQVAELPDALPGWRVIFVKGSEAAGYD